AVEKTVRLDDRRGGSGLLSVTCDPFHARTIALEQSDPGFASIIADEDPMPVAVRVVNDVVHVANVARGERVEYVESRGSGVGGVHVDFVSLEVAAVLAENHSVVRIDGQA